MTPSELRRRCNHILGRFDDDEPVALLEREGGEWVRFHRRDEWPVRYRKSNPPKVHGILFADGRVFDTVNGFRPSAFNEPEMVEMMKHAE